MGLYSNNIWSALTLGVHVVNLWSAFRLTQKQLWQARISISVNPPIASDNHQIASAPLLDGLAQLPIQVQISKILMVFTLFDPEISGLFLIF
jgi:hypothetical protein